MGVRESCQEIGELNIHDLVMETGPEKPVFFDARQEITAEDIKTLNDWAKERSFYKGYGVYLWFKLTMPDVAIEIQLDPERGKEMEENSRTWWIEEPATEHSLDIINDVRRILAKKFAFSKCDLDQHPEKWERVSLALECAKENIAGQDMALTELSLLSILKIAYPAQYVERIKGISDVNMEKRIFEPMVARLQRLRTSGDWSNFASNAATCRIVFPERFDEIKPTAQEWEQMQQRLERRGRGPDKRNFSYLYMASHMQMLVAERIVFDNSGMHLAMPSQENFKESQPSLPVRREF